jgi:hypothetical protein
MSEASPLLSDAEVSRYLDASDWLIGVLSHPEVGVA